MKPSHSHKPRARRLARIGASRMWSPARATVTSSSRARSRSAACAPADYSLPGVFPARKQASAHTGWITQITVLLSWRDDKPYTEDEVLALLGPSWIARRKERSTLSDDETAVLLGTLGLCTPPPQLLSSEAWEALLRLYGPIAIIDGDPGSVTLPTSGRIVFGVRGDGTMNGTRVTFVDTEAGDVGDITLEKLGGPYRLVHWHADAGLASGVKPTAPAPKHVADAAAPRPNGGAAVSASSRSRTAYEMSTPKWDRPKNFPREIRAFWARLDSRLHHFVWHEARVEWPHRDPFVRQAFKRLGFTDPRPVWKEGSGVDFLNMHRQMMATTRQLAINLGLEYRPMGWNPIPWRHNDPIWPMPAWPGSDEEFKKASITALWKRWVEENFAPLENDKRSKRGKRSKTKKPEDDWLVKASLDELGKTLETGIHNWMHMHWATPEPPNTELQRADPSNDWLGLTFTSHVNPVFWKLHGWIDECIDRWETAPVKYGGRRRNAQDDFDRFHWVGPVPQPPTPAAKSTGGHEHDAEISEAELEEIVANIDFTARPSFPFASLSRDELIARFGDVGEITVAELQEIESDTSEIESDTSMMASVDRTPRIVVGHERHGARGARAMAGPAAVLGPIIAEKAIDWVIDQVTRKADGSRFVVNTGDVAMAGLREYQVMPWTRTLAEFSIIAKRPKMLAVTLPSAKFTLRIDFEHNGYNIRHAMIIPVFQASSPLTDGSFVINFKPPDRPEETREARVPYRITGTWSPEVGDKQHTFTGRLVLTSAGEMKMSLDPYPGDTVTYDATTGIRVLSREAPATPVRVQKPPEVSVNFDPDEAGLEPSEEQKLKDWNEDLKRKDNGILYERLKNGAITIRVEGYASDTGNSAHNDRLSKGRAEGVKALLEGWIKGNVQIYAAPQGERNPSAQHPLEDRANRRVDVYFEGL